MLTPQNDLSVTNWTGKCFDLLEYFKCIVLKKILIRYSFLLGYDYISTSKWDF